MTAGGTVRRRVVVRGRVQAVGFRAACARQAARAGLRGHVRNLPDGAVEVTIEGPPAAVDDLVEWCRVGPPMARVEHVEVTDEAPRGDAAFHVS